MQDYLQNNVQSSVQNSVQNLSRLNVPSSSSSNVGSSLFDSVYLPIVVLIVLHLSKNMLPDDLRKNVGTPMVAAGLSAGLFYYYRSNTTMAAVYAAIAYYVFYSMPPVDEKETKKQ